MRKSSAEANSDARIGAELLRNYQEELRSGYGDGKPASCLANAEKQSQKAKQQGVSGCMYSRTNGCESLRGF